MYLCSQKESAPWTLLGLRMNSVQIVTADRNSAISSHIAALGGRIEYVDELYSGLEAIINDPNGYSLCVIDCDSTGGLLVARSATKMLFDSLQRVPIVLISTECRQSEFPDLRGRPVVLRGPVGKSTLRLGLEHALRDKIAIRMI